MNIKKLTLIFVVFLFNSSIGLSQAQSVDRDVIFQNSTIDALLDGIYDGDITFAALKNRGDFGIGTFDALDGEMIGVDGKFYQIKTDGIAYPVDDEAITPFAVVTFFDLDKTVLLDDVTNISSLKQYIDEFLPTDNIFYAIKIEGVFDYIKTRSVPRQDKPYKKLIEVVKDQVVFEFEKAEGTIIGFRAPAFVKGVNVPGYHFHFITKDKKAGGHLLECSMKDIKVEIDETLAFSLVLPESEDFYKLDLEEDKKEALHTVESK
ncbi:MAG: acetolactate decarboxylase [Candidatus Zapsychrus exili]|nr:acetolactate decarboxylase [Candidatus Zapsychrus exili]